VDNVHVQGKTNRCDDQRGHDEEEQEHLVPERLLECVEKNTWSHVMFLQITVYRSLVCGSVGSAASLSINTDSRLLRFTVNDSISKFFCLKASINAFAEVRSDT